MKGETSQLQTSGEDAKGEVLTAFNQFLKDFNLLSGEYYGDLLTQNTHSILPSPPPKKSQYNYHIQKA